MHAGAIEAWQNTKPVPLELHNKVWKEVEKEVPLFDQENLTYSKWTEGGIKFEGLRDKNQKKQGIIRRLFENGQIHEESYKNDAIHGLHVWWDKDGEFTALIYVEGSIEGWIRWNKNWDGIEGSNKEYARQFFSVTDFKK